jgi:hypothetical protein
MIDTACMPHEDCKPPPIPTFSKGLVAVLKLRLTKAIMDAKASDAKVYFDIIDRLAKMTWLDNLNPQARAQEARSEQSAAKEAMNTFIAHWLEDNPQ